MGEEMREPRVQCYNVSPEVGVIHGRATLLNVVDLSERGACVLLGEHTVVVVGDRITVRGKRGTVKWAKPLLGTTQVGLEFDPIPPSV